VNWWSYVILILAVFFWDTVYSVDLRSHQLSL